MIQQPITEPSVTEWKSLKNANKQIVTCKCPYCMKDYNAKMMVRYRTDRNGETEKQYRVECPICKHVGKTYLHESVALLSWNAQE